MNIQVPKDKVLTFTLSVATLQTIMEGLGELKHKDAKPVEALLVEQLQEQIKDG